MAAVSLQIGYPTLASVPHSIVNGFKVCDRLVCVHSTLFISNFFFLSYRTCWQLLWPLTSPSKRQSRFVVIVLPLYTKKSCDQPVITWYCLKLLSF